MNKEEKELLLKDLSARLPYEVKLFSKYVDGLNTKEVVGRISQIDDSMVVGIINETNDEYSFTYVAIHEAKPYLFPLSSMTEEQRNEYHELVGGMFGTSVLINFEVLEDFFHKNHLDYRGLIPKGLAIDATGLNIY